MEINIDIVIIQVKRLILFFLEFYKEMGLKETKYEITKITIDMDIEPLFM